MEDKEKMSVIGMVVGSKDDTDEMQMMEYLSKCLVVDLHPPGCPRSVLKVCQWGGGCRGI